MSDKLDTRVIQVTNVAPSCTNEQLRTLFSYLGRVRELKVYPPENTEGAVARVGYIEFEDSATTGVALHLSSTVFIDRALMIVPVMDGKIPDETTALQLTPQAVAGMLPGQPTWPANVVSQMTGTGANQVITTYDPRLTSLGLPQYPPLPITTDASKIEEIRRTVYVSDLDPKVTAEMLLSFFSQVGEIKYIRLAGDERAAARAAYIEFTDQRSVAQALTYNNVVFQGRTISVQHSKTNIVKPSGKMNEASQREIDEAMKKVKEASKLISAAASDSKKGSSNSPNRKRSRSKSKHRSRSPSQNRRSRSRSKGRRRRSRSRTNKRSRSRHRSPRRSRTPIRRRRSRSRGRVVPSVSAVIRRSRSRERRRSRTRSPVRRRRSRTRSKSRRRSRTPPKSYSKRSPSRNRRSRSRSKRRSRSRDRKEKIKEKKKSVSLSPPRLERNGSIPPKDEDDDDKADSPKKLDLSRTEVDGTVSAVTVGESGKAISKKRSPTPIKSRRRSPSPRKRSRTRSPINRRKRRRRTKSPSPRKRSTSRSASRHRSKRDRSKRSRSRDRKHDSKKKTVRERDDKKKESSISLKETVEPVFGLEELYVSLTIGHHPENFKVKRDYDEEEKGFASGSDRNREDSEPRSSGSPPPLEPEDKDSDHQPVDMDMSD